VANERTGTIDEVANDVQIEDVKDKELLIYEANTRLWKNGNLEDMGEYTTGTETMTFSCGCWATPSYNVAVRWYKSGNQMTIMIDEQIYPSTLIASTGYVFVAAIPIWMRPQTVAPYYVIKCVNLNVKTTGCLVVGEGLRFYNGEPGGLFAGLAGASCGFKALSITWIVASALVLPSMPAAPAVDPVIVGAVAYTTASSLMRVNSSLTNLEEVDCQVTLPAANQFKVTSGTTDLAVTADCTLDQDLSSTSSPHFASPHITGKLTVDGLIDPTGLELDPVAANPGGVAANTLWLNSGDANKLMQGSNYLANVSVVAIVDGGIPKFNGTSPHLMTTSGLVCDVGNVLSGLAGLRIGATTQINGILDEDTMVSNSATAVPTQQSTKAYVDGKIGGSVGAGTDNHIARYNGTGSIQDSLVSIDDTTAMMNFLPTTGLLDIQCDSTRALYMSITAGGSIRMGRDALSTVGYGAESLNVVAIGEDAVKGGDAGSLFSIGIGYHALLAGGDAENIAIGRGALASTPGDDNVAIGVDAGAVLTGAAGAGNIFMGFRSGYTITTGTQNTFCGLTSGVNTTSGSDNVCIGYNTGRSSSGALSQAICIGKSAQVATDYYVQIGVPGGASHSAKGYFYSQQWMDEAWRDGAVGLAKIDATGNLVKSADATSAGTDHHVVRWNGTTGLQDTGVVIDDANAITGAASITLTNLVSEFSIDGTLAGNSDSALPTERAVKTYVDGAWSTHDVTWRGAINNTASTLAYRVANGCVTIDFPSFIGAGASSAGVIDNTGTELPAGIRPAADHSETVYCQDNGTHMDAYLLVRTTGVVTIYRKQVSGANVVYSNFSSNAGNNGLIHGHTMKYKLA